MIVDLIVILIAAKIGAEVAERCRMPSVIGEITAGVLVGPSALGLVGGGETVTFLAELGVILLLLGAGQEAVRRALTEAPSWRARTIATRVKHRSHGHEIAAS